MLKRWKKDLKKKSRDIPRVYMKCTNRKLCCRREAVRCFMSQNISSSHSRSLKVIWN